MHNFRPLHVRFSEPIPSKSVGFRMFNNYIWHHAGTKKYIQTMGEMEMSQLT